jgi:hypothetical protein
MTYKLTDLPRDLVYRLDTVNEGDIVTWADADMRDVVMIDEARLDMQEKAFDDRARAIGCVIIILQSSADEAVAMFVKAPEGIEPGFPKRPEIVEMKWDELVNPDLEP